MSNIFQLSHAEFWSQIYEKFHISGGVYKLFSIRDGKRVAINRFLGLDAEGLIYIGKATSFVDRVINLKKSLADDYDSTEHKCGQRYKSNKTISEKFPYSTLFVELIPSQKPQELEKILLEQYIQVFGEVPPLNAI